MHDIASISKAEVELFITRQAKRYKLTLREIEANPWLCIEPAGRYIPKNIDDEALPFPTMDD